jgi:hypothetical protein
MMSRRTVLLSACVVLLLAAFLAPASVSATRAAAPLEQSCTYRATFLGDVTISDNTVLTPGTAFIKTWRIRNDGTCAWGPGQTVDAIEMVAGSVMGHAVRVPLAATTARGQTANISVDMVAPAQAGTYRNEWKFRRVNGQVFGLGASGATPFYVQIVVRGAPPSPPPAQGQRIQFPPGATVASLQDRVSDTGSRVYFVRALAGQTMRVSLTSANPEANFSIVGVTDGQPYKRVEVGEPWYAFQLPSTQDYRITARVASGAGTATYVLAIAITPK